MNQVPEPLPVREAYRLWAGRYETETAVTSLERQAAADLTPSLNGVRLLDAACGTGWRIAALGDARPGLALGIDLVRDMLALGRRRHGPMLHVAAADLRLLPFADRTFDVVWCRLALSYLPDLTPAYGELRRVAASGGRVIVTDFHPEASRAGHRRTFCDAQGRRRQVATSTHTIPHHLAHADAAGLKHLELREYRVGPGIRDFYQTAGRMDWYERDLGLPLVMGLAFSC